MAPIFERERDCVCVVCIHNWYWKMGGHNQKCYSSVKIDVGRQKRWREKKIPGRTWKEKRATLRSLHIKFIWIKWKRNPANSSTTYSWYTHTVGCVRRCLPTSFTRKTPNAQVNTPPRCFSYAMRTKTRNPNKDDIRSIHVWKETDAENRTNGKNSKKRTESVRTENQIFPARS